VILHVTQLSKQFPDPGRGGHQTLPCVVRPFRDPQSHCILLATSQWVTGGTDQNSNPSRDRRLMETLAAMFGAVCSAQNHPQVHQKWLPSPSCSGHSKHASLERQTYSKSSRPQDQKLIYDSMTMISGGKLSSFLTCILSGMVS